MKSVKDSLKEMQKVMEEKFKEDKVLAEAEAIKKKRGLKKRLVEGVFTDYYETGMEGTLGLCVQDRSKITPNKNYDPKDPSKGPEHWYSYEGLFFLESGDLVKVFDENNQVVYEGVLTKNRKAMADDKYRYSFLPNEVSKDVFLTWFKKQYKVLLVAERRE